MGTQAREAADAAEGIGRAVEACARLRAALAEILYGQDELVDGLTVSVLAGGHVLMEGPPGVGKTLAARALARLLGGGFARIQCVPDLLPADITGSSVWLREQAEFRIRRGPVFAHVVLADELNRATPRTQSALLEAMAEGQVTIDGERLALPQPHVVIATQNPADSEGTYPLPLSERDRFLVALRIGYPDPERERALLAATGPVGLDRLDDLEPVGGGPAGWVEARRAVRTGVQVRSEVADYVHRLLVATRGHPDLEFGISPRGGLLLLAVARARAALSGRDFVTPDDVQAAWLPVARHRIRPQPEVELEGFDADELLSRLAGETEVPR